MRTDIDNWAPLTVSEIGAIFSEIPITWCIAGGWALDLYLGRQSRKHADIDIIVLREQQAIAFQHLSKGWQLYKAEEGKLALWEEGEYLPLTNDIWVSRDGGSPWAFQIMLIDTDQDSWIYGREQSIRRPITDIIARTQEGIPFLRPEIQLLYKGGSSKIREKDHHDFLTVGPELTPMAKEWLRSSLIKQFPEGHVWMDHMGKGGKRMPKVLVVDDDAHIRELVRLYLEDEGIEVVQKGNGAEALEYAENHSPDLVILDIMMPRMDGWDLCAKLRELGDMPILMITAKGEPADRIKGFKLGTDDYLAKPFDPMELTLRVKALLKRYRISCSQTVRLVHLQLDRRSYQVVNKDGLEITLPMKEFELLYKLGSYPGQLFTRDHLIREIWGTDYEGDERTVDVHIKRLRDRFVEHESEFRIVTLRGLGYRMEVYRD